MAIFPLLKTGAVLQYPATKSLWFQNQTVRFLDGGEQRYRDSAGALHHWTIQLRELDESEMAALEQFVEDSQGRLGNFTFTDPWDGKTYGSCSLEADLLTAETVAEMRGKTSLKVAENRG